MSLRAEVIVTGPPPGDITIVTHLVAPEQSPLTWLREEIAYAASGAVKEFLRRHPEAREVTVRVRSDADAMVGKLAVENYEPAGNIGEALRRELKLRAYAPVVDARKGPCGHTLSGTCPRCS